MTQVRPSWPTRSCRLPRRKAYKRFCTSGRLISAANNRGWPRRLRLKKPVYIVKFTRPRTLRVEERPPWPITALQALKCRVIIETEIWNLCQQYNPQMRFAFPILARLSPPTSSFQLANSIRLAQSVTLVWMIVRCMHPHPNCPCCRLRSPEAKMAGATFGCALALLHRCRLQRDGGQQGM